MMKQIHNAIDELDLNKLKQLIDLNDLENIGKKTYPIEYMLNFFTHYRKSIGTYDVQHNTLSENGKKFLEIFEYICSLFSNGINQHDYYIPNSLGLIKIIVIMNRYYEHDSKEEPCCVCLTNSKNHLIQNVCLCKNNVHLECLIDLIQVSKKDTCEVCLCKFNQQTYKSRIYFPKAGIYPQPLLNSYIICDKDNKKSRLIYASIFLHLDIVIDILGEMTNDEFMCFKLDPGDSFTIKNDYLVLNDSLYTNYQRSKYKYSFATVDKCFKLKDDLMNGKFEF